MDAAAQTLAQWRAWRCEPTTLLAQPRVVETLGGGFSNQSLLVEGPLRGEKNGLFVVRTDGIDVKRHGLNRHHEWRALQSAYLSGLAPQPCYFNPELGSLVMRYIRNNTPALQSVAATGALLRDIHQLPTGRYRLDLSSRLAHYERQLDTVEHPTSEHQAVIALRAPIAASLRGAISLDDPVVLCHNDLLQGNRVAYNHRLCALDWEYCAAGSRWFDIAVVIAGDELSQTQQQTLLSAYRSTPLDHDECTALTNYIKVYRYLELLWHLTEQTENPSSDNTAFPITEKLATLQALIDAG